MTALRFILIALLLVSCEKPQKQESSNQLLTGSGKWTFIENSPSEIDYAEIEFREGNKIKIRSESRGEVVFSKVAELNDTLSFNDLRFKKISKSDGSFILKNSEQQFILYKIPFEESALKKDQIDPFYLRRSYFLVHLDFITTDEAINYLSDIIPVSPDSMPEEEILRIERTDVR